MKNGSFIYKTDIRPTRLFSVNITSLETLVSEMGTVLLIILPPLSVSLSGGFCLRGGPNKGKWTRPLNKKAWGCRKQLQIKKQAHYFMMCFISWSTTYYVRVSWAEYKLHIWGFALVWPTLEPVTTVLHSPLLIHSGKTTCTVGLYTTVAEILDSIWRFYNSRSDQCQWYSGPLQAL